AAWLDPTRAMLASPSSRIPGGKPMEDLPNFFRLSAELQARIKAKILQVAALCPDADVDALTERFIEHLGDDPGLRQDLLQEGIALVAEDALLAVFEEKYGPCV